MIKKNRMKSKNERDTEFQQKRDIEFHVSKGTENSDQEMGRKI